MTAVIMQRFQKQVRELFAERINGMAASTSSMGTTLNGLYSLPRTVTEMVSFEKASYLDSHIILFIQNDNLTHTSQLLDDLAITAILPLITLKLM